MDPLNTAGTVAPANVGQSQETYNKSLLMWLNERIAEGLNVLQNEPSVKDMDRMIAYIMGDQIDATKRPSTLMSIPLNRTKDIVLQSVSALTDIHPVFAYRTKNDAFQTQAEMLTKLAEAWWVNSFADVQLGHALRYALINTGYVAVSWDQSQHGGAGDILLAPMDPRDVIPIRPTFGLSVQDWEGVVLCETMSVDRARARWPFVEIQADNYGMFAQRTWKGLLSLIGATPPNPQLGVRDRKAPKGVPTVDVFTCYVKDRHLWQGSQPREIGEPGTNWAYTVYPVGWQKPDGTVATVKDARLYPRGRLIIATRNQIVYDGPNPYWHGMFPVAKLTLDPWPWSLLGSGLVRDLLPLQDALNAVTNGILDMVNKVLRPGVIGDKALMPDSLWARLDTRLPGLKMKLNGNRGKTLEVTEQPPLPDFVFTFWQQLMMEMDTRAGVANLQALTTLAQAPGADSIEQMKEALTPILRMKGRLLEAFLREVGDMVLANFFQFYTAPRRVSILGDSGLDLADFDYDPGNMVPSMKPDEPGYIPELDASLSIAARATNHLKNFSFQVAPNSLLAVSQLSRKMMYLQLHRMGMMDPWTLAKVLEIPNFGEPPAGAETVMDRLQLSMMMGMQAPGGELESQSGRKPSGQKNPHMEEKDDGTRQTVSES